jgi:hypothetical protein
MVACDRPRAEAEEVEVEAAGKRAIAQPQLDATLPLTTMSFFRVSELKERRHRCCWRLKSST